ncbi:MAG: thioredoxin domain-containing protein [Candidatus Nomurabacteria bacterium]|nr:thioredoxin domain-containing protein [Candidatus Nomurabacteria bacterium]USN88056.1 MAG: thioredoxin domain-containing protein [Candidatus Nomurabacteria bacterium]
MEPSFPPTKSNSSPAIPIAIIFGFGLIALAIYFSGIGGEPDKRPTLQDNPEAVGNGKIKPITDADYIRGNPNAPIMIVEYSDYDCPFCKEFHTTMKQIINEYGVSGKVAWVYRQFPLAELHPNAPRISEAALCVGEIGNETAGSDDAFWDFTDLIFNERNTNEFTNISRLPEYAELAGADKAAFDSCVKSGRHENTVKDSLRDGASAGAKGTPHTFVIVGNQQIAIEGAQSYAMIQGVVETLLNQLEGKEVTPEETGESDTTTP